MDALKPITFLEAVLINPAMYTMDGTFEEVVAFLEGYFSGVAKGNPYAPPVVEWSAFRTWLAEQLETEPSLEFQTLRANCGDSETALRKFRDLVAVFQRKYKAGD